MSQSDTQSTKELFRSWRSDNAQAGQAMAQRFADWYYAIATSHLGESRGRAPCQAACEKFGAGIVDVTESRALVGWAYQIIEGELDKAGDRATDGDEANAYTGQKKPKTLLRQARKALPEEVGLLADVYSGSASDDEVSARAKKLGGMPIGVLKARYRVKQWLRDNAEVPFEVAPDDPNLDRAPLPLYESAKMKSPAEEKNFEQWMLTDLDLCKDIAEFAHFAIALRGGIGSEALPADKTVSPRTPQGDQDAAGSGGRFALGGAALIAVALLVLVVLGGAAVAVGLLVF